MSALFQIDHLSCIVRDNNTLDQSKTILHIPSLTIEPSKVTFILGSSGVGKTSLLQSLGLMKRNFDEISSIKFTKGNHKGYKYPQDWKSQDILDIRREHFSFMFQEAHFFNNFNIEETLRLPKVVVGENNYKMKCDKDLESTFIDLGLKKLWCQLDRNVNSLSIGQKQRISFIQGLQKKDAILFADEPTGNVDPVNANKILDIIQKRVQENRLFASIVVSHDLDLAVRFAHDIIVLNLDSNETGTLEALNIFRNIDNVNNEKLRDDIYQVYQKDWNFTASAQ